jgi:hypothetical protein
MKMKYGNASQEEATIDKGYVVQPLFHKGWLSWKRQDIILKVLWILPSLWNVICLFLIEKPIDHLF